MADLMEGFLLVDKPIQKTSFYLVAVLRKISGVKKVGHAGTLDPFATGLMILLIGKNYTKLSNQFLNFDKQYITTLHLGITTDSYDVDGRVISSSDLIPSLKEIEDKVALFQGEIDQIPPMFSAKKVDGKRLYELARQGKEIERKSVKVQIEVKIVSYQYPELVLDIKCSKGTYIRSIGHDLGKLLGTGAHLKDLRRTRIGPYDASDAVTLSELTTQNITSYLRSL
ncbi:MAG: tRNA pseudouridine(55) synthase TruB [Rhabdochlamydiaceae bacterium]